MNFSFQNGLYACISTTMAAMLFVINCSVWSAIALFVPSFVLFRSGPGIPGKSLPFDVRLAFLRFFNVNEGSGKVLKCLSQHFLKTAFFQNFLFIYFFPFLKAGLVVLHYGPESMVATLDDHRGRGSGYEVVAHWHRSIVYQFHIFPFLLASKVSSGVI